MNLIIKVICKKASINSRMFIHIVNLRVTSNKIANKNIIQNFNKKKNRSNFLIKMIKKTNNMIKRYKIIK